MNPIRLLALSLLPALFSCSAVVYKMGRDPATLVGRSRASITAEFGPPLRSGTAFRRVQPLSHPPDSVEVPVEFIRVKGAWSDDYRADYAMFTDILTLGIGEPILFPITIAEKAVVSHRGQELELAYENAIVKQARVAQPRHRF
jgi:hypothetical protein